MIQEATSPNRCITYNQLSQNITATKCNSTDPLQKWIWTWHDQLYHVETSKCIQQGQLQSSTPLNWFLGLEQCNVSETKQKWHCNHPFIQTKDLIDKHIVYMTFKINMLKLATTTTYWRRYGVHGVMQQRVCSSRTFLYIYILYTVCLK